MRSFQLLGCLPWVQERLPASWSTELCFVTSGPNLGPALPNWRSKRVCWLQPAGRRTPRHTAGRRGRAPGGRPRSPAPPNAPTVASAQICSERLLHSSLHEAGTPGVGHHTLFANRSSRRPVVQPWSPHLNTTGAEWGAGGSSHQSAAPLTSREAQIKTYFSDLT